MCHEMLQGGAQYYTCLPRKLIRRMTWQSLKNNIFIRKRSFFVSKTVLSWGQGNRCYHCLASFFMCLLCDFRVTCYSYSAQLCRTQFNFCQVFCLTRDTENLGQRWPESIKLCVNIKVTLYRVSTQPAITGSVKFTLPPWFHHAIIQGHLIPSISPDNPPPLFVPYSPCMACDITYPFWLHPFSPCIVS